MRDGLTKLSSNSLSIAFLKLIISLNGSQRIIVIATPPFIISTNQIAFLGLPVAVIVHQMLYFNHAFKLGMITAPKTPLVPRAVYVLIAKDITSTLRTRVSFPQL